MKDLVGKTAFITGAASGIGLGVATRLAQAGVKVMMCDIERGALDKAVADLKRTNADVDGVRADVSLKAELQAAAEATLARYGEAHIVHNNAGVTGGGAYGAWTDAGWSWTIGVNLMAVVWGAEIFGPLIERYGQGGHIVNTASVAGLISGGGNAYNVTKYGVVVCRRRACAWSWRRAASASRCCAPASSAPTSSIRPATCRIGFAGALPNRPAGQPADVETWLGNVRQRIEGGIDPLYVGELVREGIEGDWPYIFTDNEFEPFIEMRFAGIKAGFDRVRDRTPSR